MKFTEALREMKAGKKVKLPSWGGLLLKQICWLMIGYL